MGNVYQRSLWGIMNMSREEAVNYLLGIASMIGSVSAETLSDKDRDKAIEAINILYFNFDDN